MSAGLDTAEMSYIAKGLQWLRLVSCPLPLLLSLSFLFYDFRLSMASEHPP